MQIGDRKTDILALYGEKYPISSSDLSYAYQYDLKNKKFVGETAVSASPKDAYEQIRAEFIVGEDGRVKKIFLFDLHAALYLK